MASNHTFLTWVYDDAAELQKSCNMISVKI